MKKKASKKTEPVVVPVVVPVGSLTIGMQNDKRAELVIQDDITALESARLTVLLIIAAVSPNPVDVAVYIAEHNLTRHFVMQ